MFVSGIKFRYPFLINLSSLWQAEAASDEVYAQVTLVPETEVSFVSIFFILNLQFSLCFGN